MPQLVRFPALLHRHLQSHEPRCACVRWESKPDGSHDVRLLDVDGFSRLYGHPGKVWRKQFACYGFEKLPVQGGSAGDDSEVDAGPKQMLYRRHGFSPATTEEELQDMRKRKPQKKVLSFQPLTFVPPPPPPATDRAGSGKRRRTVDAATQTEPETRQQEDMDHLEIDEEDVRNLLSALATPTPRLTAAACSFDRLQDAKLQRGDENCTVPLHEAMMSGSPPQSAATARGAGTAKRRALV